MADISALKRMALNWLSRRDYSEAALRQRLLTQATDVEAVGEVLTWCKAHNYLNQQRYVQMLVRSRANRGYGLLYILQECRQQNISQAEVAQSVAELEIDWFTLARQQYQKKYGSTVAADYKDKLKRMAYLQRRGFNSEQIEFALTQIT